LANFAHVTWPRAQLLDGRISLKFSLQTRLESESFEPLIDFLAIFGSKGMIQNKQINYVIMGLIYYYFVYFRS